MHAFQQEFTVSTSTFAERRRYAIYNFDRSISYEHLLQNITPLFFPNGLSEKGPRAQMEMAIGNFQGHDIKTREFTVDKLLQEKGLKTRIYLKTPESNIFLL